MTRERGHVAAEDLISWHREAFRPAPAQPGRHRAPFHRTPGRPSGPPARPVAALQPTCEPVTPGRPARSAVPSLRRVIVLARPVAATVAVLACLGPFGSSEPAFGAYANEGGSPAAVTVTAAEAAPGLPLEGGASSMTAGSADTRSPAATRGPAGPTAVQRVSRSTRRTALKKVRDRARSASKPVPARKPGQTVAGSWRKPNSGPMTSCFCMRWGAMHEGIDLAGPLGSPILAAGAGTVLQAGPESGFGNWVVIRHANGDVSIYGHMRFFFVHAGEHVRAGQKIALVGSEGQSTGPHLHFEIHRGGLAGPPIDPVPWLRARGIRVGPFDPNG